MVTVGLPRLDLNPFAVLDLERGIERPARSHVLFQRPESSKRLTTRTEIAATDTITEQIAPLRAGRNHLGGHFQHGGKRIVRKFDLSIMQDQQPLRHRAGRIAHQRAVTFKRRTCLLDLRITLTHDGDVGITEKELAVRKPRR
ncbi:hypothetical protein D3C87_1670880 [compost metagenome]